MELEERWINRIENMLQVQKDIGVELMSANFTRRELIELRMMISALMEIKRKKVITNGNNDRTC